MVGCLLLFMAFLPVQTASFEFQVNVKSSLHFETNDANKNPVSKVVILLKDMKKQLEKEAEEDQEIYEKMACWCETNDKEKTKAISDAEAHITDLKSSIEGLTAASARLKVELENLNKEVAELTTALDKAAAMRTKQLAEFNAEEKDMIQSISALKAAIVVLGKHRGGSALLQNEKNVAMQVADTLRLELHKHSDLLAGVLTRSQRKIIASFAQSPADYFNSEMIQAKSSYVPAYKPASGEIFGMLKQMQETFESNLSQSQKDELANQKGFEDLKAAKGEQIATTQAQIDTKVQELASTDEKLAQNKQDIEDTTNSLSADEKFLMTLKETCTTTDAEFEERQKTRQEEIEAVSKATAILSSDDAHDLFSKTLSFLEKTNSQHSKRKEAASKLLSEVAKKVNSPRLTALAYQIKLDAFTKVKKAIDDMVAQLQKEKADEIKHKDYCVNALNENDKITAQKDHEKSDLESTLEDLAMTIDTLTKSIEQVKAEIGEMQIQMKRASEDREKENKEFQLTVADQRATQKLLTQALDVLKGFYDKEAAAVLLQVKDHQGDHQAPPPPGFKPMKKNAAAGGVMGMIQGIINEAKVMEADAVRAEEDAQKAYEEFVKDTNLSIEEKSKDIVNKSEEKAVAETDKTEAEEAKENVMLELEQLSTEAADLHKECDFVVKNFDIRQTARDEEIEALKQVKAILSGAKFGAFMQT